MSTKTNILLIGRGFVGNNIFNFLSKLNVPIKISSIDEAINEKNIHEYTHVIFASGNSSPRLSTSDPLSCYETSSRSILLLSRIFCSQKWVLISTLSIYELFSTSTAQSQKISRIYATHKFLAEVYLSENVKKICILRLGYLFGDSLKKNLFYDLKTRSKNIFLNSKSILRPLNIKVVCEVVLKVLKDDVSGLFNIANTNSVSVEEIMALADWDYMYRNERYINEDSIDIQQMKSCFNYTQSKVELLNEIKEYVL